MNSVQINHVLFHVTPLRLLRGDNPKLGGISVRDDVIASGGYITDVVIVTRLLSCCPVVLLSCVAARSCGLSDSTVLDVKRPQPRRVLSAALAAF